MPVILMGEVRFLVFSMHIIQQVITCTRIYNYQRNGKRLSAAMIPSCHVRRISNPNTGYISCCTAAKSEDLDIEPYVQWYLAKASTLSGGNA